MSDVLDPYATTWQTTGFAPTGYAAAPLDAQPAIASTSGPGLNDISAQGLLSLRNPVTWFGAFAAVTFGLIAVSSSVRIGKTKAKASIGK